MLGGVLKVSDGLLSTPHGRIDARIATNSVAYQTNNVEEAVSYFATRLVGDNRVTS